MEFFYIEACENIAQIHHEWWCIEHWVKEGKGIESWLVCWLVIQKSPKPQNTVVVIVGKPMYLYNFGLRNWTKVNSYFHYQFICWLFIVDTVYKMLLFFSTCVSNLMFWIIHFDSSFMHILIWLLFTLIRLTTSFIKIKSNKIPSFCLFWGGLNAPLWHNLWPQLGPLSKIGLEPPLQVRLNIAIQPVSKNLTAQIDKLPAPNSSKECSIKVLPQWKK